MQYYWLRDNETRKNINVYWKKGTDDDDPNLVDYPTKNHPTIHHRGIRSHYALDKLNLWMKKFNIMSQALQGCVGPAGNSFPGFNPIL